MDTKNEEARILVKQYLESSGAGKWLLIIDNIDKKTQLATIKGYLGSRRVVCIEAGRRRSGENNGASMGPSQLWCRVLKPRMIAPLVTGPQQLPSGGMLSGSWQTRDQSRLSFVYIPTPRSTSGILPLRPFHPTKNKKATT
jgi:hypothetical protein